MSLRCPAWSHRDFMQSGWCIDQWLGDAACHIWAFQFVASALYCDPWKPNLRQSVALTFLLERKRSKQPARLGVLALTTAFRRKSGYSSNVDLALRKGPMFWSQHLNVLHEPESKRWNVPTTILNGFVCCLSKSVGDVIGRKPSTDSQSITRVFKRRLFVQQDFQGLEESTKVSQVSGMTSGLSCTEMSKDFFPIYHI